MKSRKFVIILNLGLILLSSCQRENIIEKQIVAKVVQDVPHLAQLESTYNLAFTNFRDNWIVSDDFYIRSDQASVFYGYSLKEADIKVITENGERVLWVKLPNPKKISTDRKVLSIEMTHEDYQPVDENGQPINVDEWMNQELDKAIAKYEEKTIEMTQTVSRQYFEALATRFGLKLKLEFISL